MPSSDMVLELKPVADDFIDAEMKGDWTDREVERAGDENVAVPEVACGADEGLGVWKNGGPERDFE